MAHIIAARAGLMALSAAALAAAFIIYESPELRRYADDVRRRIAVALHQLGDGINPRPLAPRATPMFNRPEDAYKYFRSEHLSQSQHPAEESGQAQVRNQQQSWAQTQSNHTSGLDPGVDELELSRRSQREQLLYWNALHIRKKEQEQRPEENDQAEKSAAQSSARGIPLEVPQTDRLAAESETPVTNSGADVRPQQSGLVYRRLAQPYLVPAVSADANPFSDEHRIGDDCHPFDEALSVTLERGDKSSRDDMTDVYSSTTQDHVEAAPRVDSNAAAAATQLPRSLIDIDLSNAGFMAAGSQEHEQDAFASIQSWAQESHHPFYSPLPLSPSVTISDHELISEGEATPTDSMSLVGSGEHVAYDAASLPDEDVVSISEGFATPASWSEVGSVVSENDPDFR